jgi:hypothetical protein
MEDALSMLCHEFVRELGDAYRMPYGTDISSMLGDERDLDEIAAALHNIAPLIGRRQSMLNVSHEQWPGTRCTTREFEETCNRGEKRADFLLCECRRPHESSLCEQCGNKGSGK